MQIVEFKILVGNMPTDYQAFTSKRSTWNRYFNRSDEVSSTLQKIFANADEVTYSRRDLRHLARQSDLVHFVVATIMWGYPRGMRGNHFEHLADQMSQLTDQLSNASKHPITDWEEHYKLIEPIKGIGLSTYTKLLNFLSIQVQGNPALILDERIIQVAQQSIFEELADLRELRIYNATRNYPRYLECMNRVAHQLKFSANKSSFSSLSLA